MSNLVVSNISDGTTSVGTGYVVNGSAKAWLNMNGSGPTIRNSLNMSSIVDYSVGKYEPTFTSAMNGMDYVATDGGATDNGAWGGGYHCMSSVGTSSKSLLMSEWASTYYDAIYLATSIQGDLA